ncbi:MAG: RNA-binding protein [Dermatophilaceae bacterium]
MGLNHPVDLAQWQSWQQRQRPLRSRAAAVANGLLRRRPTATLTLGGPEPRVLVVLEALKSTTRQAQLAPLTKVDPTQVAVLAPASVGGALPAHDWTTRHGSPPELLSSIMTPRTAVLSTGHYLGLGAAAHAHVEDPARFLTIQHGLLTPQAPPLAHGTTLLAWSAQDANFWRSGRDDVAATVVGSQLLWDAAPAPRPEPTTLESDIPVYLGQLHGAEIPRDAMADAARRFCVANGAAYRPHPSETDRRSRAFHAKLEADGVEIERSGKSLAELGRPVVSVFSTGVLEAAACGLPAWVDFPDPPAWLSEFWERYGMSRWGGDPTPPPPMPAEEPSSAIAHILRGMMDG